MSKGDLNECTRADRRGCKTTPARQTFFELFDQTRKINELMAIFDERLDESGTDGRSPYTAVAGAVATTGQWESVEAAWGRP